MTLGSGTAPAEPGPAATRAEVLINVIWLSADRLVRLALGVGVGAWLARYLRAEGFGALAYAQAFYAPFGALATLGLDAIVVRELVIRKNAEADLLGSSIALRAGGGVAALLLAALGLCLARPGDRETLVLVSLLGTGGLFQCLDALDLRFQSQLRNRVAVVARLAALLTAAALKVALILLGAPLVAFGWVLMIETALVSVSVGVAFRVDGGSLRALHATARLCLELVRMSLPLLASGFLVLLTMQVDRLMIRQLLDDRAVGLYAAAVRISEVWYFLPMVLSTAVAPALARRLGRQGQREQLQTTLDAAALVTVALAVATTILAVPITRLLYGANYVGTAAILALHIWTVPLVCHVSLRNTAWVVAGWTDLVVASALVTALVAIGAGAAATRAFGVGGAALGPLAAWVVCVLVFPLLSPRARPAVGMFFRSLLPWRTVRSLLP